MLSVKKLIYIEKLQCAEILLGLINVTVINFLYISNINNVSFTIEET